MMSLREMTDYGVNEFVDFINKSKKENSNKINKPDLNNEPFSYLYSETATIEENKKFNNKMELAEYLDSKFKKSGINRETIIKRKGVWTWLAYYWFDNLTNNRENILKRIDYYVATTPENHRRFYLHLVEAPYILYSYLKEDSKIFNYNPIWKSNDFTERVAANQFLISHRNIVQVINKLYFNDKKYKAKTGATNEGKNGNVRRFIRVIQQLELTFDIYSMTPEEIITILPDEFKEWLNNE